MRWNEILRACPTAVLVLEGERITYANEAAEHLLGGSSLVGTPMVRWAPWWGPGDERADTPRRLVRADGGWVWARVRCRYVDDGAERVVTLESAPRTGRLVPDDGYREDPQTVLAMVGHDLQQPIRTIHAFAEVLVEELQELDAVPSDLGICARVVRDAAHRAQRLVSEAVDYARVGHRKRWETVALQGVVSEAVEDLAASIRHSQAQVIVEELPRVSGDRTLLGRVFVNLISNALKFRREESHPTIRVRCREDAQGWLIAVEDDGIGMEPAHCARIFQPFRRLHTAEEYEGTGIGLAVCRKIVEQHGGRIWAESSGPDAGTVVRVRLPRETVVEPRRVA